MSSLPKTIAAPPTLAATLATNFDALQSFVVPNPNNDALKSLVFGRVVSDPELKGLCGAPNGSTITLSRSHAQTNPNKEITPDGVMVKVKNSAFFQHDVELIFHTTTLGCGLYIKSVIANKHAVLTSVAGLMLLRMLQEMDSVPNGASRFSNISLLAAGGRNWGPNGLGKRWGGWAVWPKYGFDMPLTKITTDMFPQFPFEPDFSLIPNGCKHVAELLTLDKGREFWEVVGNGYYMDFDPTLGSPHRTRLSTYMKRKYI
jgi:hypothetical protein